MFDDDFWVRFWDIICKYEWTLKAALSINLMLLMLLLLASPRIEPGTDSHVIMIFNLVLLVPLLVFTLYLVLRCRRRTRVDRF